MEQQHPSLLPINCKICNLPSLYTYYGVRCCEGCKQFFRRIIMKKKVYRCPRQNQCRLEEGERCRGCRMERCLQAGMVPTRVIPNTSNDNARAILGDELMQFDGMASQTKQSSFIQLFDEMAERRKMLELLVQIADKHWIIWLASTELPAGYLDRFNSTEDLIRHPDCILSRAEEYMKKEIRPFNREKFFADSKANGWLTREEIDFISVDILLFEETAKTFPFLNNLEPTDRLALFKHIIMPTSVLVNCYYSAKLGSAAWMRGNGAVFLEGAEAKGYKEDEKLYNMHLKFFCESVQAVKQIGLSREEFILLMALLHCTSTSADLSASARYHLQQNSEHLGKILMHLLQSRHGHANGAKRYAECVQLLNTVFQIAYHYYTMSTYIEVCVYKRSIVAELPHVLQGLVMPS